MKVIWEFERSLIYKYYIPGVFKHIMEARMKIHDNYSIKKTNEKFLRPSRPDINCESLYVQSRKLLCITKYPGNVSEEMNTKHLQNNLKIDEEL